MKKLIVIFVALLESLYILSAQEVDLMLYDRDVNGVEIGTVLTEEQIVEIFGEPDYIHVDYPAEGMDELFNVVNKLYYYGNSYVHFEDNEFIGFCLRDSTIQALTNHIENGIRIGDNLSILDDFKYGKPQLYDNDTYILFYTSDNPVYLIVENGIIVGIDYHNPV